MHPNRRHLLTMSATLLMASALPRRVNAASAYPGQAGSGVAHIVTGLDESQSMNGDKRKAILTAWATVMQTHMASIIKNSMYESIVFEAFGWGTTIYPLVSRTLITRENATATCATIATKLLAQAEGGTMESTNMLLAIATGQSFFNLPADRKVLNIVTDTNHDSFPLHLYDNLKETAEALNIIQNGLVIGDIDAEDALIPNHVQVGPGSFTRSTTDYASYEEAWQNKFLLDIS